MKTGVIVGTFDLFHTGHLNLLERAAALCDKLIVGINRDSVVIRDKNKTPIINESDRKRIVSSIRYVDDAFLVEDNAVQFIKLLIDSGHQPTIYFRGDESHKPNILKENQLITDMNVKVCMFPYTSSISTSIIREKI